jgi:hypothetical protein
MSLLLKYKELDMSENETRYSLTDIEVMKEDALNMGASTEFIADCLNKYGPEVLSTVTEGLRNGFSFAFIIESFRLFGPFVLDFFISMISRKKMVANMVEAESIKSFGATVMGKREIEDMINDKNIDLMSATMIQVMLEKVIPYVFEKYGQKILQAVLAAIEKAIDEDKS